LVKNWDAFWSSLDSNNNKSLLDQFLSFYRIQIIARAVGYYLDQFFQEEGFFVECGSGTSETTLRTIKRGRQFIAIDNSSIVLKHTTHNPKIDNCVNADIFSLPFPDNSIDGIWNVGVMEHFHLEDIDKILSEFHRVLKKNSKIILFWPMAYAPYEILLNIIEGIYNFLTKKNYHLYPDEISRLKTRKQGCDILMRNNFQDINFFFNFRDAFSFGVVIGTKVAD